MDKRIHFLQIFFSALDIPNIECTSILRDKILGFVSFDDGEKQNFVWHKSEDYIPSNDLENLLIFLTKKKYISIDRIIIPIDKIDIDFIDSNNIDKVWDELFDISVNMIDDDKETDSFFIHN